MKKRVSFLVLALLIAISGCGKSESSLNGQDSSEEINANRTGEDGEQTTKKRIRQMQSRMQIHPGKSRWIRPMEP